MELPTLRQLEYVVAIADHGTFGSAAVACGVSQPALSNQIVEVEQRLGVTLFERGRRGAIVTVEGEPVVAAARRVLAEARALLDVASTRQGDIVGDLVVGAIPTIAPYLLPTVVREITRRYPSARLRLLELRTAELVARINGGDVDLGLLAAPVPELDGALTVATLASDPFVLALPDGHPYAGSARLPQSALASLPMLLLEDGHCLRSHASTACAAIGAGTLSTVQATGLSSLSQMVAAGMGATLLPASALAVEARAGSGLTTRPLRRPEPSRDIVLAWRPTSTRAAHFRALAQALQPGVQAACRRPSSPP